MNLWWRGLILVELLIGCISSDLEPYEVVSCPCSEPPNPSGFCPSRCPENVSSVEAELRVTDEERGLALASLPRPPPCCGLDGLTVSLYYVGETCDSPQEVKHSSNTVYLRPPGNCTDCTQDVQMMFTYVFSGCYLVKVKPYLGMYRETPSRKFQLTTQYVKESQGNVTFTYETVGTEGLRVTWSVDLRRMEGYALGLGPSTWPDGRSGADLSGSDGALCSHRPHTWCTLGSTQHRGFFDLNADDPDNKVSQCRCGWMAGTEATVECTFPQVKHGNYCLILQAVDVRCTSYTLWTHFCRWYHQIMVDTSKGSEVVGVWKEDSTKWWLLGVGGVVVALILLALVTLWLPRARLRVPAYTPVSVPTPTPHPRPILLLYPRESQPFMTAVAALRQALLSVKFHLQDSDGDQDNKASFFSEVHDMWSECGWEEVAEEGVGWVLSYLGQRETAVVVVTSPLARRVEQGLVEGRVPCLHPPDPMDNYYCLGLKQVLELTTADPFTRVHIVRLKGDDPEESFRYIRGRTYVLPYDFDSLVANLVGLNSVTTQVHFKNGMDLNNLTEAILEYQDYKDKSPNYLNDLVVDFGA